MFLGPEGRKQLKALGEVSTIGIEMAVSVIVGVMGGKWLDEKFGTDSVFELLGLFAGLAAAFRSLYRVARKVKQQLGTTEPGADPLPPSAPPQPPRPPMRSKPAVGPARTPATHFAKKKPPKNP
jgi:ATP synthase protein I